MASGSKPNVDHEHVMARHEKYLSPYRSGFVERMMEFLEKDEVQYSSIATKHEALPHSTIRDFFAQTFTDDHDINVTTRSLHDHKRFTARERVLTCKTSIATSGSKKDSDKEEGARLKKLSGCTLMWWNDKDKIVGHHDYSLIEE